MIAIVGGLLAALGFVAGALLLAGPLGWIATDVGVALGMLFPVLTLIGWLLLVMGGRRPASVLAMRVLAALAGVLGLCGAAALAAIGAGVLSVQGINGSIPVWVVFLLGAIVGVAGTMVANRRPD